jgi:hypothetical protein
MPRRAELLARMTAYQQAQIKTPKPERKISLDDFWYEREMEVIAREKAKLNGKHPAPARYCSCDELKLRGRRLPCPPWHDCDYAKARSALCSEASRIVTEKMGNLIGDSQHAHHWTREFVRQMEKLSAPLLKQSSNGAHEQKASKTAN